MPTSIPQASLEYGSLTRDQGNTTADASVNGNDGTLVGATTWTAGKFAVPCGLAVQNLRYVGNPAAFNVGVFSVSFWYNFQPLNHGTTWFPGVSM